MLRPWQTRVWLEHSSGDSIHTRLVNQLIADIVAGRLATGALLPGSRAMSAALGLNRKTIQIAYDELIAQGWLTAQPKRGTFVSERLPDQQPASAYQQLLAQPRPLPQAGLPDPPSPVPHGSNDGIPDERLIPYELLARAYRRALITASRQQALGYGDPQGSAALRLALQRMLIQERYLCLTPAQICIVRGSQMAIYLLSRLLKPATGVMIFEELTYGPALAAFEEAGFTVLRVRTDQQGLDVSHLQQLLACHRVAAVYTTPHHHYPTTVTLSMERRLLLLQLAAQHDFYLVEDDYDHEFHFDSRPIPPLASLPGANRVLHIGSLSKVFAPGLRVGYLVADPDIIRQAVRQILLIDRQGNPVTELALAELLSSGEVKRHIRKCKKLYKSRRDHCVRELTTQLGDRVHFQVPAGGLAIWLEFARPYWPQLVRLSADPAFFVVPSAGAIRFGFAARNEAEISQAISRLRQLTTLSPPA